MTFEQFIGLGILAVAVGVLALTAYAVLTFRRPLPSSGSANGILARLKNEPALLSGLVGASVALLASFGVGLTSDQVGAIMGVLSMVLAVVVRQRVTPTAKLPKQ